MLEERERVKGYDIARAIAVFIMVFVNFDIVLTKTNDDGVLSRFLDVLQGKGAALFIVLAGVGMSLMVKKALFDKNRSKLKKKKSILFKRAVFLFVFGLIYLPLWPADILHYYGFYISIGALAIAVCSKKLWITIGGMIAIYPFILLMIDYETGWNWKTTEYIGFWTLMGFFRNLLINGFHPVIPWVAFLLSGLWLGRQNMSNKSIRNLILFVSTSIFIFVRISSQILIVGSELFSEMQPEDAMFIFGTNPMPPLPLYMISGMSLSFVIIILCIILSEKFRNNSYLGVLEVTGQMAFTHYIGHIVIGILGIYVMFGAHSVSSGFTFCYASIFCLVSVLFSWFWSKRFKKGPMSLFMRSITG
ncbi:DUF418 domain-containing protein [uncultured Aquimarina sp.]|uniref:DUF418 domain-containing protein n=1 Tax=uncultured Aquimarina sp. TaxID=575652 RepID=UPI00262B773C|nr:DUF418 domain-containing protein [uncultured Aquimarina sp.]